MDSFFNLFPEDLYHSYIVEGNPETTPFHLRTYLEERGDIEKQSPDIFIQLYDSFTIEDSSRIKEWHSERGVSGCKRVGIIGAKFINHDAERTLLKMIEEPAENTHFFIVVPNALLLLDTIVSRAHVVHVHQTENKILKNDFNNPENFIKQISKDRIELVAQIINEYKDVEGSGGLRYSAIELVNGIEKIMYTTWQSDKNNPQLQFVLGELSKARNYLSLPGASVKMILEHISLVL